MSHELTLQELAEFSANFNADPKNQVIARAAARSEYPRWIAVPCRQNALGRINEIGKTVHLLQLTALFIPMPAQFFTTAHMRNCKDKATIQQT